MLPFFEGIFEFLTSIMKLILSIFTGFWDLLSTVSRGLTWLSEAILLIPDFTRPAILAVLGIMVVYLIINHGGVDN